ncbi:MAG: hypothetical protein HBSAPP03_20090 [Phycisphaerae bacterium]|nr:MAG: hypothetical protein HBSAPP03_20090 [Phycisphaerae bacterium]
MRTLRPAMLPLLAGCLLVGLVACDDKLSQENFDKITIGMTEGQVQGILGKGERLDVGGMSISGAGVASGAARNSQVTYEWKKKNTMISITFADGKVVQKVMR